MSASKLYAELDVRFVSTRTRFQVEHSTVADASTGVPQWRDSFVDARGYGSASTTGLAIFNTEREAYQYAAHMTANGRGSALYRVKPVTVEAR